MQVGEPIDRRIPWVRQVLDLKDARGIRSPGPKLKALRKGARALGDELRTGPKVVSVRTLPLTTLLYPTTFAFNRAVPLPWPYVQMFHRCLLVQVMAQGELKNILFNPTDYEASRATPYFAKMIDRIGERGAKLITKQNAHVDVQLAKLGLSVLALITFAVMVGGGMIRQGPLTYVKNLLPAGLPLWLMPLMAAVELVGLFVKPFALMVRLFANMLAGHLLIIAFVGMIFVFAKMMDLGALSWSTAIPTVGMAVFINIIEAFVVLLQAYIFMYLSVLFVQESLHPAH